MFDWPLNIKNLSLSVSHILLLSNLLIFYILYSYNVSLRLGKLIDLKVSCEFFGWFSSVLACVCPSDMQAKFMHMSLYVLLAPEAKSFLQLIIIVYFKRVGSIQKNICHAWEVACTRNTWSDLGLVPPTYLHLQLHQV